MNGTQGGGGGTFGGIRFDKDNAKEVVTNLFAAPKQSEYDEYRGKWTNKWQFLLALLAHSISLRTMFLVTYVYINHGRWAILIPCFLMFGFYYHPVLSMETMLGQFSSRSYSYVLHTLAPPYAGLSNVMFGLNIGSFVFYTTVAAYPLVHVFKLIGYQSPWESPVPFTNGTVTFSTPSNFYFIKEAAGLLNHYEDHSFKVMVMITIPVILLVIGVFLYYDHRIIKNAIYVTAIVPIILFLIVGIKANFPVVRDEAFKATGAEWHLIGKPEAWFWSVVLVVHLLGQGHGINTALASYIDFRENLTTWMAPTALISLLLNTCAVPVFCEFASFLHHGGVSVELLKNGGFNLLFLKYSDFLEAANVTKFWAVLFYLALFFFEFHSLMIQGFVLFTLLTESRSKPTDPETYRKFRVILLVILLVIVAAFSIGAGSRGVLPPIDQCFWFALIFQMLVIIGEILAACWYYNFKRLGKDFLFLYGKRYNSSPGYIAVVGLLSYVVIVIMLIVKGMPFAPKQYWVVSYGVLVAYVVLALLNVLVVAIFYMIRHGIKRDNICTMNTERREGWEPSDPQHRMEYEGFLTNEETVASA